MFQNRQKVVVVSGGDPTRVIRVQEATGTDSARYPTVTTDGVPGRDQQVQIVTGYDESRAPYLIGVNSFSPADLSPAAWFRKGIGITESGGAVSQWNDQSGNSRHLKQASAGNQPTLVGSTISFDGTGDYMKCDPFTLNQPATFCLRMKQVTWTNGDRIFDGNSANSQVFQQSGTTPTVNIFAGGIAAANGDMTLNTFVAACCKFNGASSSIRIDNNAPTTGNAQANNAGGFTLGANPTPSVYSRIDVEEVAIFAVALSDSELDSMVTYLLAL